VVLYPSCGHFDSESQTWRIEVRGTVFEEGAISWKKQLLLRVLQRVAKVRPDESQQAIFESRIREFIAPTERGKRLMVRVGDNVYRIRKKTKRNGRFIGIVRIPHAEVDGLRRDGHLTDGWLDLQIETPYGDDRGFAGRVQLIDSQGVSVISDIDDTIKVTDVHSRRALLENTFLREFRAIDGMAEIFQDWESQGALFHFVSSSPWPLYSPLEEFLKETGFPGGTFHLRSFRLHQHMLRRLLLIRRRGKMASMHAIIKRFPQRQFLFVGDSGEHDPEFYGTLARKFPAQVVGIYIRNLAALPMTAERCRKAFREIPAERCLVFRNINELPTQLPLPVAFQSFRA
jgi:phosphatidate phosphatase APP1